MTGNGACPRCKGFVLVNREEARCLNCGWLKNHEPLPGYEVLPSEKNLSRNNMVVVRRGRPRKGAALLTEPERLERRRAYARRYRRKYMNRPGVREKINAYTRQWYKNKRKREGLCESAIA